MAKQTLNEVREKMVKDFPSFVEAMDAQSIADLEKNLLILTQHKEDTVFAKKNCQEIIDARDALAFLVGPYNDTLKALTRKMAYIHMLVREQKPLEENVNE